MVIEADGEDWQAFQYGMKISKSSFFRTIGDGSNFELTRNTEHNFRKKKFGLFCFNCNGTFFGLLSLAFSNKAKIINLSIPEKVKTFIEKNLVKEINHFRKKYKFEFNLISDKNLILPEYKIDLLNKNKKIIKKIENLEKIEKNFIERDFKRKKFANKKFITKNKFKKKYNYHSKERKYNFDNKKLARY